jgi:hypothetical protein
MKTPNFERLFSGKWKKEWVAKGVKIRIATYVAAVGLMWLAVDMWLTPGVISLVLALTAEHLNMADFFHGFMQLFTGLVAQFVVVMAVSIVRLATQEK